MENVIQTGLHGAGSLSIRSGLITGHYLFDHITNSIVDCLRAFDRHLYFGYMHRNVFLYNNYLPAKDHLIKEMIDIDNINEDRIRNIGFCMYMTRVAQNQRWRYPALLNRDPAGRVTQITGNTRAFASMMVHDNPWEHYPILFAEHPDFNPNELLKDPVLIDSDEKLHEILGLDPTSSSNEWNSSTHLNLRIEPYRNNQLWCRLDYIGDGTYHDHNPKQGRDLLDLYQQWRSQYPMPVPLAIYTQWPGRIINRNRAWQTEIVGTTENMLLDDRPGTAERAVRDYHQAPTHAQDHVLWVIRPRTIDLDDLLMWVDISHSTYISSDWSFVLWRRQEEYCNMFINVSQQEG